MKFSKGFRDIEGGCVARYAESGEFLLGHFGDGLCSEGVRKRLEGRIVLEGEVGAFVGFDQEKNWRVGARLFMGRGQREPVGMRKAGGAALPGGKGREIVAFARHREPVASDE